MAVQDQSLRESQYLGSKFVSRPSDIEVRKLIHPNAIFPHRYNNRPIAHEVSRSVIAFITAFLVISIIIAAILGLYALSAITAAMTNSQWGAWWNFAS